MKKLLTVTMLMLAAQLWAPAQQTPADSLRVLKVVDTLTQKEKASRVPILLKSELDSLVALHMASIPQETEPVTEEEAGIADIWPWLSAAALLAIFVLIYLLWSQQKKSTRSLVRLYKQIQHLDSQVISASSTPAPAKDGAGKKKTAAGSPKDLAAAREELEKLQREKQGMEMMLSEYRHVKQEYESLKQQMMDVYKVRHYPGFSKEQSETDVLKGLVTTERSVAQYAYDHFLKPVIQLTDANKNHPAKISDEDRRKIADCLVSMGLLYSEYLYLRISELSVGGKMVERIGSLKKGNGIDPQLLKELNTEHGSRALALRMALDKMGISHLSYPVFEETNLNLS